MATHPVFGPDLTAQLKDVVEKIGVAARPEDAAAAVPASMRRKRGYDRNLRAGNSKLSLVADETGILSWVYQPAARGPSSRRARFSMARQFVAGTTVHEIDIRETPPNEVIAKLTALDGQLTPDQGLRQIVDGKFAPADGIEANASEATLLLVHGTFSKSDMFVEELGAVAAQDGQPDLLRLAAANYAHILAFDHPTLSVSPWINAIALERALVNVKGPIDVICHSRGGLVVAWWLRNGKRNVRNVVFVGSPLQGTSLASPANLRAALDVLANIANLIGKLAGATAPFLPFLTAAQGLAAIFSGTFHILASTPLADAVVAVVPGLAGQSRVANNFELTSLNYEQWPSLPKFYAVKSNFQPKQEDPGWQIWKYFYNPKDRLLNWGADLIFQNDENDLVVNTQSMTQLYRTAGLGAEGYLSIAKENMHDFGNSADVYHTNYFRQPETVRNIQVWLGIG